MYLYLFNIFLPKNFADELRARNAFKKIEYKDSTALLEWDNIDDEGKI